MTQEQYQQLMQGQGYIQDGEYGQEMMQDPNAFLPQERAPEDEIREKIDRIIEICTKENAFFGDQDFPATDASLYNDPENKPSYTTDMPPVEWRRPHEISPDIEPVMFTDSMNPGNIR
jgi:hypothetical protein